MGGRSQSGWSGRTTWTLQKKDIYKYIFRTLLGICTLNLNPSRAVLICQINHIRYPRDNRSANLEGNVLRKISLFYSPIQ